MSEGGRGRRLLPGLGLLAAYALTRPRRLPPEAKAPPRPMPGEEGAGGYYAVWDAATADGPVAHHIGFQYAGMRHQGDTALSGMWLFLATELLFFAGLFFPYVLFRAGHFAGFAEASRHAELTIGIVNTALLLTSSAVLSYGLSCAEEGRNRALFWACIATAAIGIAFMGLKSYEWMSDFGKHLFPGPDFSIGGPDPGGTQLFWCFYFVATGLHGVHLLVGIGLVGWIAWGAHRGRFSPGYVTPVEAVGLYWSFVDMVWLVLFPMIYLVGRIG